MNTTPSAAPAHWACDVVLVDGGSVHIRPIERADGPALVRFHEGLSPETVYLRFFAPKPTLSQALADHLTDVDHDDRVALVAEVGGLLVGVARYDREPGTHCAEVAFVVADRHQGRGIGTALLEHLAAAARERGVTSFVADALTRNHRMLEVFRTAGFEERTAPDGEVTHVELLIEPTDRSRAAMEAREHRAEAASVRRLLAPRAVAVIGASRNPAAVGHQVLKNLLNGGFAGPVYPVNPSAPQVASVKAYPTVLEVPDDVDLAVVAVPSHAVLDVAEQCARKGVAGLVVLSAGFGEVGGAGTAAQHELAVLARRHGMRVVGPNCIGVANTAVGLNATFSPYAPTPGHIGMQSQSGALGIAILERSARIGLGVSSFVSVGNKVDVSGNDLLQYWEDDPGTTVVLLYLESFGNPRKFSRIARRVSRRKPIVAVKSGRSAAGMRAASSHTAAMASPDVAVDALFRQTGVIRVDTLDELFDMAMLLDSQPLPGGRRVAIVGNSGGPGILATDACDGAGLTIPELGPGTQEALRKIADENAAVGNPVDLVASATPEIYEQAVRIVLADEAVDAAIVINTSTYAAPAGGVAAVLPRTAAVAGKPVVACFLAWPDMQPLLRERRDAPDPGPAVPAFASPEPAARALARAAGYAEWRRRPPGVVPVLERFDVERARTVVSAFLAGAPAGGWLPAGGIDELLAAAGVQVVRSATVASPAEAAAAASRLGFPVAVKASGPGLVHKSDVGGVQLDLRDEDEVAGAYASMAAGIGAGMSGAVVQQMAEPGVETIVGVVQDPLFGPLVMLGLGGVATELLGDRTFRVLPLTDLDAAEMVRSLRSSPLLFGYRGAPPAAVDALESVLQRVARLAGVVPEVQELDLNPVIVSPSGAVAVDARVLVSPVPPAVDAEARAMS
ncbi:MAG TPA: GNAT family N-acetyltransferase [Acidimicrobiales bacterium]|nr:GNAT family N-acetyltransferase [Acidimicrobiales bacterium]